MMDRTFDELVSDVEVHVNSGFGAIHSDKLLAILKMIQNTNEGSASKCWETINKIKGGEIDEKIK